MGQVQMKNLMLELKLEGMLQGIDQTLKEAAEEAWGSGELLDTLLLQEKEHRERKKSERLLKNAKLKITPALEDFDFTAKRSITKAQIKDLLTLNWCDQGRPILLIGPTGVGKTFLSQALGHEACRRKRSTLFMSVSDFLEHQMLHRASGTYLKLRNKLIKPDVLIFDDFGLRKWSSQEGHDLLEILEERIGEKSTLFTTQLPLTQWSEVIEDPVIADAIIDRLIHASIQLTIKGDSYRKVKAKLLDPK